MLLKKKEIMPLLLFSFRVGLALFVSPPCISLFLGLKRGPCEGSVFPLQQCQLQSGAIWCEMCATVWGPAGQSLGN